MGVYPLKGERASPQEIKDIAIGYCGALKIGGSRAADHLLQEPVLSLNLLGAEVQPMGVSLTEAQIYL